MPVTSRRRWDGCITYLTPTLASSWPVLFSLWEIRAEGVTLALFRTINPVLYVEEAGLQMREHFKDSTHFITRVTTLPVPSDYPGMFIGSFGATGQLHTEHCWVYYFFMLKRASFYTGKKTLSPTANTCKATYLHRGCPRKFEKG